MIKLDPKIYELTTGQYQISYQNPINGKRKRKKFDSEKHAKLFCDNLKRQYVANNLGHFSEAYVGHLIERHLKECPQTRFTERKNAFQSFYDEFATVKLNALSITALRQWFQKIKDEHDYSERTLSSIKNQTNCFFKYLVEQKLISNSPLTDIKFKRKVAPKRPRVLLSVEEVKTILANAKTFSSDVLFPYLYVVANTGARKSEMIKLKREHIDFNTGLLHLRNTKNGDDRSIRMSETLSKIIETQLNNHKSDFVFAGNTGDRFHEHQVQRMIDKFRLYFPMSKDWTLHGLRHSFAYNFLKNGGKMYQLQAVLGHRSIGVTVDLYGQLQAQDVENISPYENNFNHGELHV